MAPTAPSDANDAQLTVVISHQDVERMLDAHYNEHTAEVGPDESLTQEELIAKLTEEYYVHAGHSKELQGKVQMNPRFDRSLPVYYQQKVALQGSGFRIKDVEAITLEVENVWAQKRWTDVFPFKGGDSIELPEDIKEQAFPNMSTFVEIVNFTGYRVRGVSLRLNTTKIQNLEIVSQNFFEHQADDGQVVKMRPRLRLVPVYYDSHLFTEENGLPSPTHVQPGTLWMKFNFYGIHWTYGTVQSSLVPFSPALQREVESHVRFLKKHCATFKECIRASERNHLTGDALDVALHEAPHHLNYHLWIDGIFRLRRSTHGDSPMERKMKEELTNIIAKKFSSSVEG